MVYGLETFTSVFFIVLRFSESVKQVIVGSDQRLHPIEWTNDSFRLIINNEYANFTKDSFSLGNLDATIEGYFFLVSQKETVFAGFKKLFSSYQLSTGISKVTKIKDESIYFPIEEESAFWQFGQASKIEHRMRTITFAVKRSLTNSIVRNAIEWKINVPAGLSFTTQDEIYYKGFVYFSVMVRLISENNVHFFARVNNKDPSKNPEVVLVDGHHGRIYGFFYQFLKGQVRVYYHRVPKVIWNTMEAVEETFSQRQFSPGRCVSFGSYINRESDYCDTSSIRYYDKNIPFMKIERMVFPWPLVSVIYIGGEINREKFLFVNLDKNFRLAICDPNCIIGEGTVRGELEKSWIGIDTVSGYIIAPLRISPGHYRKVRFSLFDCVHLTSCASCEMVGFYQKCEWTEGRCKAGQKTVETANVCFKILTTTFDETEGRLTVKSDYKLDKDYDIFWFLIDNEKKQAVYQNQGVFQTFIDEEPDSIELYIKRTTGSYIKATFAFIKLEKARKTLPWLTGVIVLLVFTLILASISAVYIRRKKAEGVSSRAILSSMLRSWKSSEIHGHKSRISMMAGAFSKSKFKRASRLSGLSTSSRRSTMAKRASRKPFSRRFSKASSNSRLSKSLSANMGFAEKSFAASRQY